MLSNLKIIFKHSTIYAISEVLKRAVSFIMIPVYTYYLTPADYGVLELLDLTLEITAMLIGLRLGAAIVRYYHHYSHEADKHELFTTALIFSLILNALMLVVLQVFSHGIALSVSGSLKHVKGFEIVFYCLAIQNVYLVAETYLIAKKKSLLYASLSLVTLFLNLGQNILYIVVFKWGIYGILYSMLVTKTINALIVIPIALRDHRLKFSIEKLRRLVRFGLPLVPAAFSMFSIHFSDRFFIQKYCEMDELGLYSLGYKFGMIVSVMLSGPIFRIWNTHRFEIATQPDAKNVFSKMFTYYTTVIFFAGLLLSMFSTEIIQVMASDNFQGATVFIPLIVASYIFYGMANFLSIGIMITYKTKYQALIQFSAAIVNLLFNFIFITKYGIIGAAYSTVLTFAFLCGATLTVSQRLYPIPFEYLRLAKIIFFSVIFYSLSNVLQLPLVASIGCKSAISLLFPISLLLSGFFEKAEILKGKEILNAIVPYVSRKLKKM